MKKKGLNDFLYLRANAQTCTFFHFRHCFLSLQIPPPLHPPLRHNVFKSLPNDKILHQSKWKAFADENKNVNETLKFGLGRVEIL